MAWSSDCQLILDRLSVRSPLTSEDTPCDRDQQRDGHEIVTDRRMIESPGNPLPLWMCNSSSRCIPPLQIPHINERFQQSSRQTLTHVGISGMVGRQSAQLFKHGTTVESS